MGTSGWSTNTHSPSRRSGSERRGLASTAVFRSAPRLALGIREQRGDRALQLGLRRLEPRAGRRSADRSIYPSIPPAAARSAAHFRKSRLA